MNASLMDEAGNFLRSGEKGLVFDEILSPSAVKVSGCLFTFRLNIKQRRIMGEHEKSKIKEQPIANQLNSTLIFLCLFCVGRRLSGSRAFFFCCLPSRNVLTYIYPVQSWLWEVFIYSKRCTAAGASSNYCRRNLISLPAEIPRKNAPFGCFHSGRT